MVVVLVQLLEWCWKGTARTGNGTPGIEMVLECWNGTGRNGTLGVQNAIMQVLE